MGLVIVLACLAVPAGHQAIGHRAHRKILRAVFQPHGPEVPPTPHELRHRHRTPAGAVLVNGLWLAYLLAVLVVGIALR
jgi:hypothetical protein